MRVPLLVMAVVATIPAAQAEEAKPVRVIPITRESAEASAALLRSPQIGPPPIGRMVRQSDAAPQPQQAARKSWKDAQAAAAAAPSERRATRRVEIWKPTATGGFAVEAYSVSVTGPMARGY